MAERALCSEGGYLVGPDRVVPRDPAERQLPDPQRAGAVVGCNRLVCQRCGCAVVQRAGLDATPELLRRRRELLPQVSYDCTSPDGWDAWVARGMLEVDARVRLYLCGCALHAERMVSPVEEEPDGRPGGPARWRCAGHPARAASPVAFVVAPAAASEPVVVDSELAAWVEAVLERGDAEALDRRYRGRDDPALRHALATAVLAQVVSRNPRHRMRALGFFSRNPSVPEAAQLVTLYAEHRALFDIDDPFGRRASVAAFFYELAADRIDPKAALPDADQARELLRAALLGGEPVPARALAAMASFDQPWLAEHAVAWIAAARGDGITTRAVEVVYALRGLSLDASGRRTDEAFAELVRAAAAVPGVDRERLGEELCEALGGTGAEVVARALGGG